MITYQTILSVSSGNCLHIPRSLLKRGDTLLLITSLYSCSFNPIAKLNSLIDEDIVRLETEWCFVPGTSGITINDVKAAKKLVKFAKKKGTVIAYTDILIGALAIGVPLAHAYFSHILCWLKFTYVSHILMLVQTRIYQFFTGVEIWKMKSPERQLVWTPTLTMRSCVSVSAQELYEELYEEAR